MREPVERLLSPGSDSVRFVMRRVEIRVIGSAPRIGYLFKFANNFKPRMVLNWPECVQIRLIVIRKRFTFSLISVS